jgi:aminopeptidase-like protein
MMADLVTPEACAQAADSALAMMRELYPICRSITGEGARQTLAAVAKRIPLALTEVPSGTPVFDWEVPREWNVREAWIADPDGRRIVDLRNHTLHLMSYSTPIRAHLSLDELQPHLHSIPDRPDWIPYRTSYYKDAWGFCLTHRQRESLKPGRYEVCVDTTLEPGSLTYGEFYVRGQEEAEVLLFTHTCHPSLCNDNLTGIAVATAIAAALQRSRPRFSYRIVFAPGTIGSITWLAQNEARTSLVRHGLVLGLLGDRGALTYKRSRRGNADIDRIAALTLAPLGSQARVVDFSPYGYDERQLCSPGFNLPVGRLTRSPNSEYAEYHSSADDFSLIDRDCLAQSIRACAAILRTADRDATYVNLNPKCEPRLGKRGLYRALGGAPPADFEHALFWILNQSDGEHSLLAIAERSRLPFEVVASAADALAAAGLLRAADPVRVEPTT